MFSYEYIMLTLSDAKNSIHFKLVDLTHPLNPLVPTWSGDCGYKHTVIVDYPEVCRVQTIEMNAGTGTHLDAPSHFIPGAKNIADISIEDLIVPIVIMDVTHKAHADYYISANDIAEYEKEYGKIQAKSLVIGRTGWDRFWHDTRQYRNPDKNEQM